MFKDRVCSVILTLNKNSVLHTEWKEGQTREGRRQGREGDQGGKETTKTFIVNV